MARRRSIRRDIGSLLLNLIAIGAFIFPLFALGYFVSGYSSVEPRPVNSLATIPAASTPRLFEEPLISVTFDDGWQTVYTHGAPLLEKYGIRTTQYVLLGEFDDRNYMSLEQMRSLKAAGHEIASHSMTHRLLTKVRGDELAFEVKQSKEAIIAYGLAEGNINFAAPESETDAVADESIIATYYSHRNTYGDLENGINEADVNVALEPFDRHDIIGYSVSKHTTPEHLTAAMEYAKKHNGWLILVYHQIESSPDHYAMAPNTFRGHLKLIDESGIKTATMKHVLDNQQEER